VPAELSTAESDSEALAGFAQRLREIEETNRLLEQEVVQHRMIAELARGQSEMLIQSLNFLAAESNLDKFLGHVLKVTVQQLQGVGGTLEPVAGDNATFESEVRFSDQSTFTHHFQKHIGITPLRYQRQFRLVRRT